MTRTVMVPLDGSPFAEQALPAALDAARRLGASLDLVLVHRPIPAMAPFDGAAFLDPKVEDQLRVEERQYLARLSERPEVRAAGPVTTSLLEGPVASALADHARVTGASLVVMTTHGRGPVSRFWLGSVADRLLRTLEPPILLVRPGETRRELPADGLHVLIPLDGSGRSDQAVRPVEELGLPPGSVLTLLEVIEPVIPVWVPEAMPVAPEPQAVLEERRHAAMHHLHELAVRLRKSGHVVHVEAPIDVDVPGAILRVAHDLKADLIAIATRGLGGATRLLLGSVTDKVVRGAEVPVLVWRRPESG
ncbi:MAG: universal stress protein [Gemmatimonadales bacterium]|nr:universal stress protein [Gemmatimonadales bacterium]